LNLLLIPNWFFHYAKKGRKKERKKPWPIYVKKRIFIFWRVDVYDTIGLLGSVCTLAILVFLFYLQWKGYTDERSYFYRVYQIIRKHTNIYVDYSDLTVSLFLGFRCVLLILERIYNAYQYTRNRVNWSYYFMNLSESSIWSILFCFGRKVDYEKVLKKYKKEYLKDSPEGSVIKGAFMDFYYIDEFERQIRTQKTFDVLLLSIFQIHDVWRDFRIISYWETSRKMGFNMHKTLLCIVSALTCAWIVNWWEESQSVVHPLTKGGCESFGFRCIGSFEGVAKDDPCMCVQTIERSIINLLTAVLVGIVGLYASYAQILKIIFRNWLRLDVVNAVWEATNFYENEMKSEVGENKGGISSSESLVENRGDGDQLELIKVVNEIKPNCPTQSEDGETTCGFAMDRKAVLDDVFLLAMKKGSEKDIEDFKELVNSVKDMTKKVRDRKTKTYYNQVKDKIAWRNMVNSSQRSKAPPFIMVNLTRRIRNLIMQGTTIFTLAASEDNLLLLVAKGKWSGGAFLPTNKIHKAISHTATQHYELSFSQDKNEVMIERGNRYSIYNRKFKACDIHSNSKLAFACNNRLTREL